MGGWSFFERLKEGWEHFASYWRKPEFNGVFTIEDYDLSPYHDQPGKFEREEGEGEEAKKIEQALFFIPLILLNGGSSESAKMLDAGELVKRGFFIHKDQICPKEIGRPLVFHYTSSALKLEDKKATCKVRVRALDNGDKKTDIKDYERARVLWASVMIEGRKGKVLKESAWNEVKKMLDDVNDWSQLEETVLEQPHEQEQFNIKLHKTSNWAGADKTFAKVEIDLTKVEIDLTNGAGLWRQPGHFYDKDMVKNHFYIFPLAIAPRIDEEKYNKLGTPFTGWKEVIANRYTVQGYDLRILASYAVTAKDVMAPLAKIADQPLRMIQWYGENVNSQTYGYGDKGHPGIDLGPWDDKNHLNPALYFPTDGEIYIVKKDGSANGGFGYYVVYYPNGFDKKFAVIFAHLKELPNLKSGKKVEAGNLVGYMGSTGNSTGVHLHYEIRTKFSVRTTARNPIDTEIWSGTWHK